MGWLPDGFQSGPLAPSLAIGWLVSILVTAGCGGYFATKERAAFIAANLHAPEEKDLLKYIFALLHDGERVQDQAAPIVCELLGRLSEDQLAYIPEESWRRLCKYPEDTPSGYSDEKKLDRNDQVHVAVFTAIMKLKRMKSLPYIERWMEHLNVTRHSGAFVRTLHQCHETLLNHQASLQHSSTLLRPSSAEAAAAPDVLLRPAAGTHQSSSDKGEQLLRASAGQDTGFSNWDETCLPAEERGRAGEYVTDIPHPEHIHDRRL